MNTTVPMAPPIADLIVDLVLGVGSSIGNANFRRVESSLIAWSGRLRAGELEEGNKLGHPTLGQGARTLRRGQDCIVVLSI